MIKKFKKFINENITDLLIGKSDKDIEKELDKLSEYERYKKVKELDLDDSLLPKNLDKLKKDTINKINLEIKKRGSTFINRSNLYYDYTGNFDESDYEIFNINIDEDGNNYYKVDELYATEMNIQIVDKIDGTKYGKYNIPYDKVDLNVLLDIAITLDYLIEEEDDIEDEMDDEGLVESFQEFINKNVTDLLKPKSNEDMVKAIKNYITNNFDKDRIFIPYSEHIFFDENKNGYTEYIVTLNLEGVGVWVYNKNNTNVDSYVIPYGELNIDMINKIANIIKELL